MTKPKRQQRSTPTRRNFIGGMAFTTTAGATGLYFFHPEEHPKKPSSFAQAVENPRSRQSYIDAILNQHPPPHPVRVMYDDKHHSVPNPILPQAHMIMRTGFTLPPQSEGIVLNGRVIIYRSAFEACATHDEFISTLVDHEYEHVNLSTGKIHLTIPKHIFPELQNRAFDVTGDLFGPFQELHAYGHQIKQFPYREQLRNSFKKSVIRAYDLYRNHVSEQQKTPLVHWLLAHYPEKPQTKLR